MKVLLSSGGTEQFSVPDEFHLFVGNEDRFVTFRTDDGGLYVFPTHLIEGIRVAGQ